MNLLGTMKRPIAAAIGGVLALTVAMPSIDIAQAHNRNFASRVTISPKFNGDVNSNRRCRGNRRVVLKKKTPGPDDTKGSDTTGPGGNWRISKPRANGRFYAVVTRDVRGGYGHRHVCESDRSGTIRV